MVNTKVDRGPAAGLGRGWVRGVVTTPRHSARYAQQVVLPPAGGSSSGIARSPLCAPRRLSTRASRADPGPPPPAWLLSLALVAGWRWRARARSPVGGSTADGMASRMRHAWICRMACQEGHGLYQCLELPSVGGGPTTFEVECIQEGDRRLMLQVRYSNRGTAEVIFQQVNEIRD